MTMPIRAIPSPKYATAIRPASLMSVRKVAIIEMVGHRDIIEEFIEEVRPTGIVEMIRTGVVSMGRGTRIHDTNFINAGPLVEADESATATVASFEANTGAVAARNLSQKVNSGETA